MAAAEEARRKGGDMIREERGGSDQGGPCCHCGHFVSYSLRHGMHWRVSRTGPHSYF